MTLSDTVPLLPFVIAQIPSTPPPGIGEWLRIVLYIVGVLLILLKAWEAAEKRFGHNPPIDHVIEQVNVNLKGLTPLKDFEARNEEQRLRDVGLEKQISEVRHEVPTIKQFAQTEDDHLRVDVKNSLDALRKEIIDANNARSRSVGNLHEQLKAAEIKLAAVDADNKTLMRKTDSMDNKIDRLLERTPKNGG
jgi:hypothetical protein